MATVFGTRPQYIKLSVLWRAFEQRFRSILIDSGQHYDFPMSGAFHRETGLRLPDYHLGIGSASAATQIARLAERLDGLFGRLRPDAVIVVGDTNTTVGGALAAAYRNIPVAHVEAGLRSFDLIAAEEKNRRIADHLSTWAFCPTGTAVRNLRDERALGAVIGSGDVLYENWRRWSRETARADFAASLGLEPREFLFITCHRAETVDDPDRLRRLVTVIGNLDCPAVFAVHPRARKNLIRLGEWSKLLRVSRLHLTAPLPHLESLTLVRYARAVLTDSGGVQREAYWFRTPCLILRDRTEWVELVQAGASVLCDLNPERVTRALRRKFHIRTISDPCFRIRRPSERIGNRLESDLVGC